MNAGRCGAMLLAGGAARSEPHSHLEWPQSRQTSQPSRMVVL